MSLWRKLSRLCVAALIGIAAWIARTICVEGQAWNWIVVYWAILTVKNLFDFLATAGGRR